MNRFSYYRAADIASAVSNLAGHRQSRFIAGGTNLLDLMKENVMKPDHLVDISQVPLKDIVRPQSGGLQLGALVTNAETAWNKDVEKAYPLLSQAILAGASPQLRNMATNGGNLMQRTRCYYFYDTATPCNKREPGSGCSAINGYNRILAILGTSEHCIATHPSDMCIALAALEAEIITSGKHGERRIPIEEFHRLPGDTPNIDNNLYEDEMIVAIALPDKDFTRHYSYLKLRDRTSYAFALVSVAAAFNLADDRITEARLALGGVAHKPWRRPEAEQVLSGKKPVAANFAKAADILLEGAKGYGHNNFKIELAKRAIVRALTDALNRNQ